MRKAKNDASAAPQGARVMRSDEYQALAYAVEACRQFTTRQTYESFMRVTDAMRMLSVFTGWREER
jgi:hypothetical protein